MRIGVLAVQGDYDAHRHVLQRLGANPFHVRKPEELDRAEGLVIPGGESSTFLNFLQPDGFFDKLKGFVHAKPTFGTCAGAILLAKDVVCPEQPSLAALDVRVRRNAYGRQSESSIRQGTFQGSSLEMSFIRAPKIERVGRDVEVLAWEGDDPVLVSEKNAMAATFHPELTDDTSVHEAFLDLARAGTMRANVS
jgi:pyridoxal 5'-phosphate synthase pdxT subunit